jgi:hypothetical protein
MEDMKLDEFEVKLKELLKEYNLEIRTVLDFPRYKILPLDVQLALQVLENHGGIFNTTYNALPPLKEEPKKGEEANG